MDPSTHGIETPQGNDDKDDKEDTDHLDNDENEDDARFRGPVTSNNFSS